MAFGVTSDQRQELRERKDPRGISFPGRWRAPWLPACRHRTVRRSSERAQLTRRAHTPLTSGRVCSPPGGVCVRLSAHGPNSDRRGRRRSRSPYFTRAIFSLMIQNWSQQIGLFCFVFGKDHIITKLGFWRPDGLHSNCSPLLF